MHTRVTTYALEMCLGDNNINVNLQHTVSVLFNTTPAHWHVTSLTKEPIDQV